MRHFFRSEVTHDRAAIGDSLNNPLFFEFEERKPDVGTMRVELLTEILLDQPLARMTPAKDDVLFQAGRDDTGDGRLPRAAFRRSVCAFVALPVRSTVAPATFAEAFC